MQIVEFSQCNVCFLLVFIKVLQTQQKHAIKWQRHGNSTSHSNSH